MLVFVLMMQWILIMLVLACLACFFLAFLPPSEATFAPEATTENSLISSSTSVSVSVRKVYRIRGKVLELEKKKNRSLLNFIRRSMFQS